MALNVFASFEIAEGFLEETIVFVFVAGPAVEFGDPDGELVFFSDAFDEVFKIIGIPAAVVVEGHEVDPEVFFLGLFHEFIEPGKACTIRGRGG